MGKVSIFILFLFLSFTSLANDTLRVVSDNKVERTSFYEDGGKRQVSYYDFNNNKIGKWTYYHRNGNLYSKGVFKDDKRHGVWFFYDESGSKIGKVKYKMGEVILVKNY